MRVRVLSCHKLWNFRHWAERAGLVAFVVPGLLVAAASAGGAMGGRATRYYFFDVPAAACGAVERLPRRQYGG